MSAVSLLGQSRSLHPRADSVKNPAAADERVAGVSFDEDSLSVRLKDGRTISVPLTWYPRLFHATTATAPQLESRWRRIWYPLARHRGRP
jgi:hypothetical protein